MLFVEDQQKLTQIENMIDSMKFENLEAYFVIYAKDNIKFVIKSGDLIVNDEIKINFAQRVTAKSYEGMIQLASLMSGENLSGEVQSVTFVYAIKESGKGKFAFEFSVLDQEVEQLKISGTLAFVVEKNALSVKPDVKLEITGVKASIAGEYRMEKIGSYTFIEPKDVKDFAALLGTFFAEPQISDEILS